MLFLVPGFYCRDKPLNFSMTSDQQEAFLSEPRVGIFAFNQGGESPLMTPMWFVYENGAEEYWFITSAESRKGKLLFVGSPIAMLAQKDTVPHKYVSVRGKVTKIADASSADWQSMADHYGVDNSESIGDTGLDNPILIHVRIERWISYDEAG
jgi:nitroimidazol reductase NimA-like FMN-containing flavoprotein (pyridoxamine 5'-phosphate oxidase superfamily)